MREIVGGDNSMIAGYWWGHVTSVHAKYTPLCAPCDLSSVVLSDHVAARGCLGIHLPLSEGALCFLCWPGAAKGETKRVRCCVFKPS